jgi:hypothetical protein
LGVLKLQQYVQSSLAPRANQKLSFRFFGHFQILQKVGDVAYKLALPASSLIHPVFHVSRLKKDVDSKHQVTASVPSELSSLQVPERVLQRRLVARGAKTIMQVLIKWSALPESLSTWEDLEAIK